MAYLAADLTGHISFDAFDRRGGYRTSIDRPAVLRLDALALDIHVDDLTRDGCRITTDAEIEIGAKITLGLAGIGHCQAIVVRREDDRYGCVFDEPLASGAVTAALQNNVDPFTGRRVAVPLAASDVKWSPRSRLLFVCGSVASLWVVIGAAVFTFIH